MSNLYPTFNKLLSMLIAVDVRPPLRMVFVNVRSKKTITVRIVRLAFIFVRLFKGLIHDDTLSFLRDGNTSFDCGA
jgi:hypothetical protein